VETFYKSKIHSSECNLKYNGLRDIHTATKGPDLLWKQ